MKMDATTYKNFLEYKPGDATSRLAVEGFFAAGSGNAPTPAQRNAAKAAGIRLARKDAPVLHLNLLPTDIRNALSTSQGTTGAFAKYKGFIEALELALDAYSVVRRVSDVVRASGDPVKQPAVGDVGEAIIIPDESNLTETSPTFRDIVWNLKAFFARVPVANEWTQDTPQAVEKIGAVAGEMLATRQNRWYTKSNGGLIAGAGNVSSYGATVTGDDLENLVNAVNDNALDGAQFMLSPSAWLAVRKMKTGDGARMYQDGKVADFPYCINTHLDAHAGGSGTVPILFGNFRKGFRIVDHEILKVEPYPETLAALDQTLWVARQRSDGAHVARGGRPYISKLTMSA